MLDAIQGKMGIENDADSELAELEMETRPEAVVAEIERLQRRVHKRKKPISKTKLSRTADARSSQQVIPQ